MSQEIKPALVVIDMEEGFLNENSPLYIKQAQIRCQHWQRLSQKRETERFPFSL